MKGFAIISSTALLMLIAFVVRAQSEDTLSPQDRLKACDSNVATEAAYEILHNPASWTEPLANFAAAQALFKHGKADEALFWFYAAQLRARYQLIFEKGDHGQALPVVMMSVGPALNNYGFSNTANLRRTLDKVLAWDSSTPNRLRDTPHSADQDAQIAAMYADFHKLRKKVVNEQAALEQQARLAMQTTPAQPSNRDEECAPGQIDPSLVNRETRKESRQVEQIVREMPEVAIAAGLIQAISVMSHTTNAGSNMPWRYSVYVRGDREIFVDVDVDRQTGTPQFRAMCVSSISPHRRKRGAPCPAAK